MTATGPEAPPPTAPGPEASARSAGAPPVVPAGAGGPAPGAVTPGAALPAASHEPARRAGPLRRAARGAGYLGRGLRMWITSPRLMLLGALPALIVGVVYVALLALFAANLDAIAAWATPFADGWAEPMRVATRFVAGAALVFLVVLLAVFTFVAVTLAVGDPFYERIWRRVEERMGDAPAERDEPWWRALARGLGETLRVSALTACVGVLVFAIGFVPIAGQIVAPVLGALVGGWFIALELSTFALEARGLRLRDRRRMLRGNRATTLGFGVLAYLLFLVPGGAVVTMPAAVAGATLLSRDAVGASTAGQP